MRTLDEIAAEHARRSVTGFAEWLARRLNTQPRCPITHYLLACHTFDRGRRAIPVRHMMIAHHSEPEFESAALLVFAGLNWIDRRGADLLPVLLDTWEEFRRPEFDRRPAEQRFLDRFAKPLDEPNGLSPLALRLWRLPIRTLRTQIREAVRSRNAPRYSLLLAPA